MRGACRPHSAAIVIFFLLAPVALCGRAFAQSPHWVVGPSPRAKWLPYVDFGGRFGNKRNIGGVDIFQPLAQSDDTLLFADVRGRFDDQNSREGNAGLGLRHMLSSGWNVGVYGYYDRRRSPYGNYFNQATFGGELLGRDWDFRVNGYLPFGDTVKTISSITSSTSSSTSTSSAALAGTAIRVTTDTNTSTMTTTRTTQEVAEKGFDAEVGWRVPLWSYNADKVLRLYAGGYYFGDGTARDVAGPRLRLDFTMLKVPYLWDGARLTLGAEWQYDAVRGSQAFATVRLRVPLGAPAAPETRLTPQERRMVDPVVRDVDVVAPSHTTTTTSSSSSTSSQVQTATETAGGKAITVLSSASTPGANLPAAVAGAGANSVVILSGTFITTAATTLASGQTLMGAGTLTVRAPDGQTASLTTSAAAISAATSTEAVNLANNSTVTGLTVANSSAVTTIGINAAGVSGATISNSTITAFESGAFQATGVEIGGGSTVTVSGNTITATAPTGAATGLDVNGASATVTGNTLSASGATNNHYANLFSANIGTGSSGNTAGSGGCYHSGVITGSITFTNAGPCP